MVGIRTSSFKYFRDKDSKNNRIHLYDLNSDPNENNNCASANPKQVSIMEDILQKLLESEANVIATGTNEEKLNAIKNKYDSVRVKKFDISNHSKIEEFIENASNELGGLDILVNLSLIHI